MDEKIIFAPPKDWIIYLQKGHKIWLVKEKKVAFVKSEMRFDYSKTIFNGMFYIRLEIDGNDVSWHTSSEGKGFDGSLILLPIEGNLLSNDDYEKKVINGSCKKYNVDYDFFKKSIDLYGNKGYDCHFESKDVDIRQHSFLGRSQQYYK